MFGRRRRATEKLQVVTPAPKHVATPEEAREIFAARCRALRAADQARLDAIGLPDRRIKLHP